MNASPLVDYVLLFLGIVLGTMVVVALAKLNDRSKRRRNGNPGIGHAGGAHAHHHGHHHHHQHHHHHGGHSDHGPGGGGHH